MFQRRQCRPFQIQQKYNTKNRQQMVATTRTSFQTSINSNTLSTKLSLICPGNPGLLLWCEEKPMLHQALCDSKSCLCTSHLLGPRNSNWQTRIWKQWTPKLCWTIPCTSHINWEMYSHTYIQHTMDHNGIFMTIHPCPWHQSHFEDKCTIIHHIWMMMHIWWLNDIGCGHSPCCHHQL